MDVRFSPNGGCAEAITAAIRGAKREVLVQAYWFTSDPVADVLIEARRRNIRVEVILDGKPEHDLPERLQKAGVPVWFDNEHRRAHNKVIIIDQNVVITGSYNLTPTAESDNAENLLIVTDAVLAAKYVQNWEYHRKHSNRM